MNARSQRWLVGFGLMLFATSAMAATYEPREGDVVFQSLRGSPLKELIEGATESKFSHCGMVVRRDGRWMVIEAVGPVREIALADWIAHGVKRDFAAFRLDPRYDARIPAIIAEARKFLGRPYDFRYRFDDEKIYCSELVFKAFQNVTGELLGRVRKVRELKWEPYEQFIEELEGGPVPLDRELITPRDLSEAWQLRLVYRPGA
jgi:hypothetical protein